MPPLPTLGCAIQVSCTWSLPFPELHLFLLNLLFFFYFRGGVWILWVFFRRYSSQLVTVCERGFVCTYAFEHGLLAYVQIEPRFHQPPCCTFHGVVKDCYLLCTCILSRIPPSKLIFSYLCRRSRRESISLFLSLCSLTFSYMCLMFNPCGMISLRLQGLQFERNSEYFLQLSCIFRGIIVCFNSFFSLECKAIINFALTVVVFLEYLVRCTNARLM